MLCQKVHLTFHPKNFCNVALQNCLNFSKNELLLFFITHIYIHNFALLTKRGRKPSLKSFFVSPTKLTGLSMFFCNTCYLIATRYPWRKNKRQREKSSRVESCNMTLRCISEISSLWGESIYQMQTGYYLHHFFLVLQRFSTKSLR